MRRAYKIALMLGGMAFAVTAATAAYAQNAQTPKSFNYEIKDGKRVPKAQRTVNPDGSTREEIRKGACVMIKEKSADGTVRKTDRCD